MDKVQQVIMLKDVGSNLRGSIVWLDKDVASTLVLDGLAERVHQDHRNYSTRPGPVGESR